MLILEFCDKENQNGGLLETKKKKKYHGNIIVCKGGN